MTLVILLVQCLILCLVFGAVVVACLYAPWPSPLIRWLLPVRRRWPETQIREWLEAGHCHPAYLAYFYRDPERVPPPGHNVLAPADGIVIGSEVRSSIRYVVIALSFWDMHVQRSPMTGQVLRVESMGASFVDNEGRDFVFLRDKLCPVQKRIVVLTEWGELAVRLVTSLAARRIEVWVSEGQRIDRGQRIGRILLGSTVVLEVPKDLHVLVKPGERVWAGQTVVANSQAVP